MPARPAAWARCSTRGGSASHPPTGSSATRRHAGEVREWAQRQASAAREDIERETVRVAETSIERY